VTRAIVVTLTAPIWIPALAATAAASIVIGMMVSGISIALRDRPTRDDWS
jgi:hypothetical protein